MGQETNPLLGQEHATSPIRSSETRKTSGIREGQEGREVNRGQTPAPYLRPKLAFALWIPAPGMFSSQDPPMTPTITSFTISLCSNATSKRPGPTALCRTAPSISWF